MDTGNVAAGRMGAFMQMGANVWDFVTGAAIPREVGDTVVVEEPSCGPLRMLTSNLFTEVRSLTEGAYA